MKIQRNAAAIRRISLLLLLSMLLSVFTGYSYTASAEELTEAEQTTIQTENEPLQEIETEEQIFARLTADTQLLNYIDETAFRAAGHVKRLPEEEDLHSYVFENADGTRTAYIMNEPVKYVDSTGAVREKNMALSAGKISGNSVLAATVNTNAFTVSATDYPTSFPSDLSQGVRFTYGEYTLNLRPETVNTATTALQAYGKMMYRNAFGSAAHLMYTPQLSGLKEDIALTHYTGLNTFSFLLDTDGLIPAEDAGGWYLWDGTDPEMQVRLGQVISYDAGGNFSVGTMTVTHQGGSTYRLTLTVDTAFLESATYPVTVDPSITVWAGSYFEDTTILMSAVNGSHALDANVLYVGYANILGNWQVARSILRLNPLPADSLFMRLTASQINSCYICLYSTNSSTLTMNLYRPSNTEWNESSVTWDSIVDLHKVNQTPSELSDIGEKDINITAFVKQWKSGNWSMDEGVILAAANEPSNDKCKVFSSTESSALPYIKLNYIPGTYIVSNSQYVEIGGQQELSVYVSTDDSHSVEWESKSPTIATVDQNGFPSTGEVNTKGDEHYIEGVEYNGYCIYGENKTSAENDGNVMCAGCTYRINQYFN